MAIAASLTSGRCRQPGVVDIERNPKSGTYVVTRFQGKCERKPAAASVAGELRHRRHEVPPAVRRAATEASRRPARLSDGAERYHARG